MRSTTARVLAMSCRIDASSSRTFPSANASAFAKVSIANRRLCFLSSATASRCWPPRWRGFLVAKETISSCTSSPRPCCTSVSSSWQRFSRAAAASALAFFAASISLRRSRTLVCCSGVATTPARLAAASAASRFSLASSALARKTCAVALRSWSAAILFAKTKASSFLPSSSRSLPVVISRASLPLVHQSPAAPKAQSVNRAAVSRGFIQSFL